MAYGGSKPPGPRLEVDMHDLLPYRTTLNDGTAVVLKRLFYPGHVADAKRHNRKVCAPKGFDLRDINGYSSPFCTLESTLASAHQLLNYEITQGNSYPFESAMTADEFNNYFVGYDCFCLRVEANGCDGKPAQDCVTPSGEKEKHTPAPPAVVTLPGEGGKGVQTTLRLMDPYFIGCFYIKPNYPGRSKHLCNGGFLVSPSYRNRGAGVILGDRYRHLAQRLGYRGSVFNLVFLDNPGSNILWERLGFTRVGLLPDAGRHLRVPGDPSSGEVYVAAYIWYLDLTKPFPPLPAKVRKLPLPGAGAAAKPEPAAPSKL